MAGGENPNGLQYEVTPVDAKDVPPPPSYEEVMGQYVTSVQQCENSPPSLAYIDIMPRLLHPGNIKERMKPTFQSFDDLVVGANVWLRDNPGLTVWNCETVERKVSAGQLPGTVFIDLENMVQHEATFGFNCFVFGLRLWLTPKTSSQSEAQEIGMMNVFPLEKSISVTVHQNMLGRRGRFNYGGFGIGISQEKTMITYEGLKKSLDAFNKKVQEQPIPGTIINVESTTLKFAEGRKQTTVQEAASSAMWFELDSRTSKRFTQIMRIFYTKGQPSRPAICMKEFVPQQLSSPTGAFNFQQVRFGTFPSVIEDAAAWVQQQSGIQIMNMETRFADVNRLFNDVEVDTDSTDHFEFGLATSNKLRFLRIFYISNSKMPSYNSSCVSSRLFVPVSAGRTGFESMTRTMTRIDQWLKLTGLPIFGVETVPFLRENLSGNARDRSNFSLQPFSAKHWVTAIRVYFLSAFEEPTPNPFPTVANKTASSSCNIL